MFFLIHSQNKPGRGRAAWLGALIHKIAGMVLLLAGVQLSGAQTVANNQRISSSSEGVKTSNDPFMVRGLRLIEPAEATPLAERQRFQGYVQDMFGVVPVLSGAAGSAFSQALDSPREWGQGAVGYGRRLANDVGYNVVRQTLSYGTARFLHEDNRYFASGKRQSSARIAYAITSTVMARHDDGSRHLSVSSVSGIVGATLISRAWSPPSWQHARNIGESIGITFATTAGFNVAREYVPDLIRHLQKK